MVYVLRTEQESFIEGYCTLPLRVDLKVNHFYLKTLSHMKMW